MIFQVNKFASKFNEPLLLLSIGKAGAGEVSGEHDCSVEVNIFPVNKINESTMSVTQ